jgi:hypothetical protein
MTRLSAWSGFFVGAVTSVVAIAVFQLGSRWGLPAAPFDVFEWLTRILPGAVVTAGIDAMVSTLERLGIRPTSVAAKLAEQGMALGLFVIGSAILGMAVARIGGTRRARAALAGLGAGAVWLIVELVTRTNLDLHPPSIDPANWRLVVDGLVARRLSLTLDDLQAMPSVSQMITLECISNPVGGDLIGTSLWTGVRLRDVLARAGMGATARAVHIKAADGFYESVALAEIEDKRTLLVYAMNREPLPEKHGFPLRMYIPDRHGMKLPKWITQLHVSDRDGSGYYAHPPARTPRPYRSRAVACS